MNQIPADFERFVQNLRTSHLGRIKLTFVSVEELKYCTSYFWNEAVKHHELSAKFAEAAAKLYFVAPPPNEKEESINFRKALIAESQLKVEELESLLERRIDVPLEKALGIIKLFGELYNVGFIFKGILKKHLDLLGSRKQECYKSNNCYYLLIETVKARVRTVHETDYGVTVKTMIEEIEEAEQNPTRLTVQIENKTLTARASPKKFDHAFPKLNSDEAVSQPTPLLSMNNPATTKKTLFQRVLNELQPDNSAQIIQQIEEQHSYIFEYSMWHYCYEKLISTAINNHELAGTVIEVCAKLPRGKVDAWRGNRNSDYKNLLYDVLNDQIRKFFNQPKPSRAQLSGFVKFIKKLLEKSQCSIEYIDNLVNIIASLKDKNASVASDFLAVFFVFVRQTFSSQEIKKLSCDTRNKVLDVVRDGKKDLKELDEYLFGNSIVENIGTTSKVIAEGLISSTRSSPISVKSSASSDYNTSFDYSSFCDELMTNDTAFVKKSLRALNSETHFNLIKFAQVLFEKSTNDEADARHLRLAVIANEILSTAIVSFKNILVKAAVTAFAIGLKTEVESNENAVSIATYVSELYKLEWLTKNYYLQCMDLLSKNNFESSKHIEMMKALLEPATTKIKSEIIDDRFMFYLQLVRAKRSSAASPNDLRHYIGLIQVLEKITHNYESHFDPIVTLPDPIPKNLIELRSKKWSNPALQAEQKPLPLFNPAFPPPNRSGSFQELFRGSSFNTPPPVLPRLTEPQQMASSITSIVIDFDKLKFEDEKDALAFDLKSHLTSVARIVDLINALTKIKFMDYKQISTCADLLERLTSITIETKLGKEIMFKKCLLEVLNIEFVKTNGLQTFDESEKNQFANVSVLIAELYRRDIFTDEDLSTWLLTKHIRSVPVQHLTHLSSIITPKIQAGENQHLKMILGLVEDSIINGANEVCSKFQSDINKLAESINYLRQFKDNSRQNDLLL